MKAFLGKYSKVLTGISIVVAALAGYGAGTLGLADLLAAILGLFGLG